MTAITNMTVIAITIAIAITTGETAMTEGMGVGTKTNAITSDRRAVITIIRRIVGLTLFNRMRAPSFTAGLRI